MNTKCYLFLLIITCLFSTTNAQFQKNTLLAGGTGSVYFSDNLKKINGSKLALRDFSTSLSPTFGKMVKDNFMLGFNGTVYFRNRRILVDSSLSQTNNRFNFLPGIMARYYFPIKKHSFFINGDLKIGFTYSHNREIDAGIVQAGGQIYSDLAASIGPGFSYRLSPRVGLETSLIIETVPNGFENLGHPSLWSSRFYARVGFQLYFPPDSPSSNEPNLPQVTPSENRKNNFPALKKGSLKYGLAIFLNYPIPTKTRRSSKRVSVNPLIGYFLRNNWLVGGGPDFSHGWHKVDVPEDSLHTRSRSTGVGLTLILSRVYFPVRKVAFFAELGTSGYHTKSYREFEFPGVYKESRTERTTFRMSSKVGLTFFLNPKASVDISLNYSTQNLLPPNLSGSSSLDASTISLSAGFSLFHPKREN